MGSSSPSVRECLGVMRRFHLALTAILLAVFTLLAYLGYVFFLGQSLPASAESVGKSPAVLASATTASYPASSLLEVSL